MIEQRQENVVLCAFQLSLATTLLIKKHLRVWIYGNLLTYSMLCFFFQLFGYRLRSSRRNFNMLLLTLICDAFEKMFWVDQSVFRVGWVYHFEGVIVRIVLHVLFCWLLLKWNLLKLCCIHRDAVILDQLDVGVDWLFIDFQNNHIVKIHIFRLWNVIIFVILHADWQIFIFFNLQVQGRDVERSFSDSPRRTGREQPFLRGWRWWVLKSTNLNRTKLYYQSISIRYPE